MKKYVETTNHTTGESFVIDPKTGELMDFSQQTIYIQTEEQRRQSKEQFKKYQEGVLQKTNAKEENSAEYKEYGNFIWSVYSLSQNMFPQIKPSNITRLMFLSTYMGYNDYLIDGRKSIGKQRAYDLLGLSDREFNRFYSDMIDTKIIIESDKKLYMNRDLFTKGSLSKRDVAINIKNKKFLTRIYVDGVRALYSKATPRSHKTLSYIFQVIPFVNRQYNICCHNPLETDLHKIEKMSLGDFCDVISYDKNNTSKLYNILFEPQFEIKGEIKTAMRYVVDKGFDKKSYSMFINPSVYYAGDRWNEVKVLGQF